jgi:cell division protein FtsI/penicillin-binding protein 2
VKDGLFQSRLKVVGAALMVAALAVAMRLVWLQVVRFPDFRQMASRQQLTPHEVRAERGQILDRNGVPMAVNVELFNVSANPSQVSDKPGTATALSRALGVPYAEVLRKLHSSEHFVWIARGVPFERSDAVDRLRLSGVGAYREQRRFYPDHEMAAHVLGFTGRDNQGLEGIEARYEHTLAGHGGYSVIERDAHGRSVLARLGSSKAAHDGMNVVTTIDKTVQHITQVELEKAFVKYHCKEATAAVMDPTTGEILALANYPSCDPNHYQSYPVTQWLDRAVNSAFEPGSTFKLVTAVGALEEGVQSEDDRIFCENGKAQFDYGRVVTDHEKYGWLTFREVFGYSSNIGMVKVGQKLGKEALYKWIRRFGFGQTTGIELPGEAAGNVAPPEKWSGFSMTSIPYGYEVTTSPLQMMCAYAAIANGGVMMRPMLVKRTENPDGGVDELFHPRVQRKVCSTRTARRMTAMLRWVVEKGTGTAVDLPNFAIAGKTGTAHKVIKGRYSPYNYVSSFVGFVPMESPKYVIYVSLDDPRGLYWGAYTSGPVFKEMAKRVLAYGCVQGAGQAPATQEASCVPAFQGLTEMQCRRVAERAGVGIRFAGKGPRATSQSVASGQKLQDKGSSSRVTVTLGQVVAEGNGGSMPDLRGKTKRQAIAMLAPLGVRVSFRGQGLVRGQFPLPGAAVPNGTPCDLSCETQASLPVPQRKSGT